MPTAARPPPPPPTDADGGWTGKRQSAESRASQEAAKDENIYPTTPPKQRARARERERERERLTDVT